jgi:hypothetical protein
MPASRSDRGWLSSAYDTQSTLKQVDRQLLNYDPNIDGLKRLIATTRGWLFVDRDNGKL